MKIMHVITGLNDGGAEAALYRLCVIHRRLNYEISVVSLMDMGKYGYLLQNVGVSVITLGFPRGSLRLTGLLTLYRSIKIIDPDIVQTWMLQADFVGGLVAKFASCPNIFWSIHHSIIVSGGMSIQSRIIRRFNAILSKWIPKKIIYCAESARKESERIGYERTKGVVIHNGFDPDYFFSHDRLKCKDIFGLQSYKLIIGHVGRWDVNKHYENLFSAFRILLNSKPGIYLALVGNNLNASNSELLKIIKQNGLESVVILLGQHSKIPQFMSAIDFFVSSSKSEAFPNVINEAMLCETPCIATNVGDVSDIIGGTGIVVPPNSSTELAFAMENFLDEMCHSRNIWALRKKNARRRIIDNYSLELMSHKYIDCWSC